MGLDRRRRRSSRPPSRSTPTTRPRTSGTASCSRRQGRVGAGARRGRLAVRLDPLGPGDGERVRHGAVLRDGATRRRSAQFRRALELQPGYAAPPGNLVQVYLADGQLRREAAAAAAGRGRSPPWADSLLHAWRIRRSGRRAARCSTRTRREIRTTRRRHRGCGCSRSFGRTDAGAALLDTLVRARSEDLLIYCVIADPLSSRCTTIPAGRSSSPRWGSDSRG